MTTDSAASTSAPPAPEPEYAPLRRTLVWRIGYATAYPLSALLFDLKVHGAHHVPATGGVLIVSNHQSFLDPVLLGCRLRRPMSYLARHTLFEVNRFFTWLIRSLNAFPVRQGRGDVGAMKETIKRLQAGQMLNIYPEGSRTEDGEIGRIEPGAALVIRRAGVPVVPAVIHGSFESWPRGTKAPRPHPVRVMFGPPLRLEGLKPAEITALIDQTLRGMFEQIKQMYPQVRQTGRARRVFAAVRRTRGQTQ